MLQPDSSGERGLAGQAIFVAGAGTGIGRAVALCLARAGANLALFDIRADSLEAVAESIGAQGRNVSCHTGDVTNSIEVKAAVDEAVRRHATIHGAVNSAGVLGASSNLLDYPEDVYRRVLDVNIMGVVNCMKAELSVMVPQARGAIVNIASAAGIIGWAGFSAYVASKHAVVGLTKTAGLEYAARGVRINSVCPAFIYTKMTEELLSQPGVHDAAVNLHPIGRLGQPEEVAEAVLWLLSERSSFAVGSNLVLDGGSTID
jgi:NAD(P)-dependent dehydrogenase (short-subunit alcohol dehydrogenase family)